MQKIITTSAYLAPISHYALYIKSSSILFEQWGFYEKKTLRNRATIMGSNGPIQLSVPVISQSIKTPYKDVKIAYHMPWQINQWRTIVSAYQSSPFFEFYADDLEPFYTKKFDYLHDFNIQLTNTLFELIETSLQSSLTINYLNIHNDYIDYRNIVNGKNTPSIHQQKPYRQVFSDTLGFMEDLSIIDLLFCKGPETFGYLKWCEVG